jgi:hypothetical protein
MHPFSENNGGDVSSLIGHGGDCLPGGVGDRGRRVVQFAQGEI